MKLTAFPPKLGLALIAVYWAVMAAMAVNALRPCSSAVEHSLGKGEVSSSSLDKGLVLRRL